MKRITAFLLAVCMAVSFCPAYTFAAAIENSNSSANCTHQHNDACGFVESKPASPCNHQHDESCYVESMHCIHVHTEDCTQTYAKNITSEDIEEGIALDDDCPHRCSVENGCIVMELDCKHEHDADCGYCPAVEGCPCNHVCDESCCVSVSDEASNDNEDANGRDDTYTSDSSAADNAPDGGSDKVDTTPEESPLPDELTQPIDETTSTGNVQIYEFAPNTTISVATEEEFRAAIYAVNDGNDSDMWMISLSNDLSLTGDAGVKLSTGNTTILGNGHTLFWDGADDTELPHSLFTITGTGTVLNLSATDGSDVLYIDGKDKNSDASLIEIGTGVTFNINQGAVIQNVFRQVKGAAIYAENAVINISGGKIINCRNTADATKTSLLYSGAAIYAKNSEIYFYDGEISHNQADSNGTVSLEHCTFAMYGGNISHNKVGYYGGGIIANDTVLELYGGTIEENWCNNWGGGIYAYGGSYVHLHNGASIKNNEAASQAGGMYIKGKDTKFVMDGGRIAGNHSPLGGGVELYYYAKATINGGIISENTSIVGSAFYVWSHAQLDLRGGDIVENTATGAGTIFITTSGIVNVYDGGNISNNTATSGGAFRLWLTSTLNIYGGTVKDNTANQGGAISLYGNLSNQTCVVNIYDGIITGNTADFGGAVLSESGTVTITGGTLTDNHATESLGGGVYAMSSTVLSITGHAKFYNNTAKTAGDDVYYIQFDSTHGKGATASLTLETDFDQAMLNPCEHRMTGWYVDGMLNKNGTPRWSAHDTDKPFYFVTVGESLTEQTYDIALKAAHPLVGDIVVAKEVSGNAADPTKSFDFTMMLQPDPNISNTDNPEGFFGDVFFQNGVANFTLKSGESVTVKGIPIGTICTVRETTTDPSYCVTIDSTKAGVTGEKQYADTIVETLMSDVENDILSIQFYNEANELSISKNVTGSMGDRDKFFPFTITLTDSTGTALTGKVNYRGSTIDGVTGIAAPDDSFLMLDSSGTATFYLKHGQSITLYALPSDVHYTICENNVEQDGYITAVQADDEALQYAYAISAVVPSDTPGNISFTNHRESAPPMGLTTNDLPWFALAGAALFGMLCLFLLDSVFRKREKSEKR